MDGTTFFKNWEIECIVWLQNHLGSFGVFLAGFFNIFGEEYSLSVIFTTKKYSGEISDEDSEVLEHKFFRKDEVPLYLFPCDSRAILDWAKGTDKVIVD